MNGLRGIRVVDFSSEVAGPYCTKLFADAGADVIKVEAPEGDSLRKWSATGADPGDGDSPLFRYLNGGKRSLVGQADDTTVMALIADADLVVEDFGTGMLEDSIFCRIECFVAFRTELARKHGLLPPPDKN